jgi:hypothetical protein
MAKASEARQFRGVYEKVAVGSTSSDVTSIASGAQALVVITVPGVALDGTWVTDGVATNVDPGALDIGSRVTAANTVTVVLQNNSGGAIDPPLCTYRVVAMKLAQAMTL